MNTFEKSIQVLEDLFARDYQFALATCDENIPSVRFVDTFYYDGAFYVVTHAESLKVLELELNEKVALCNKSYRFSGMAHNIGHPLKKENSEIRHKLMDAFSSWYFKHNNENDKNMCYIKIDLSHGFFYKDGTGYDVDFINKQATEFTFTFDIKTIDNYK